MSKLQRIHSTEITSLFDYYNSLVNSSNHSSTKVRPVPKKKEEFNDDEDLAEIQLDMVSIIIDLAIGQDDVKNEKFCLQTLEKLENHDEIEYCSYSVDNKKNLESSLGDLGTIAEKLVWENDYYVYLIKNSEGTKIYYYDSVYNSGTLYDLN